MKKFIDELIVYLLFMLSLALLLVIGSLDPVEYFSDIPVFAVAELKGGENE